MISSLPCHTDESTSEALLFGFILALCLGEQPKHIIPGAISRIESCSRAAFKGSIVSQGIIKLAVAN